MKAVDWLGTTSPRATIVFIKIAQARFSVIEMTTQVILCYELCRYLPCPGDHFEQLVCKKGTRSRRKCWVQSGKDVRHDSGMRVISVHEILEVGAGIEDICQLLQKIRGPVWCVRPIIIRCHDEALLHT